MFSYPYLANNGYKLYRDFIYPYPPLLTVVLGYIYGLFGYSIWVLKILTWALLLANDILIFLIVKKISKNTVLSSLALFSYVLLQPFLEGNMMWFDVAVVTPLLLAFYFLLPKSHLLAAGLFLAIAILTKQTAVLFLMFSVLYILFKEKKFNKALVLCVETVMFGLVLVLRLYSESTLSEFFKWVLIYPLRYWGEFPGYVQMNLDRRDFLIIFLLLAPFIFTFVNDKKLIKRNWLQLLMFFLISSLISIYPRFSFFHFQSALAFLCISYGALLTNGRSRNIGAAVLVALILLVDIPKFRIDWGKEDRFYGYGDKRLANIISWKVPPGEKVFLLGPHSGLYAFSRRLPPKPWTDSFGWYLEIPGVQEEIINRWEQDRPFAVFWNNPKPGNWFDLATYQPKLITGWIKENYVRKIDLGEGLSIWERKN